MKGTAVAVINGVEQKISTRDYATEEKVKEAVREMVRDLRDAGFTVKSWSPKYGKTYSEYIKDTKAKMRDAFFGEVVQKSNKYFTFDHIPDKDTIILVTSDIKTIRGSPVLIVGNNKAVYLKDWQIRKVHDYYNGFNAYAVKLQRAYFKPYTFRTDFEDYYFKQDETFDSLKAIARSQNGSQIAMGHMR